MRSMYSSYMRSRSASRMRCRITCLAVWAAMRPKSSGVTSTRSTSLMSTLERSSPISSPVSSSCTLRASTSMCSGKMSSYTRMSPVSVSTSTLACSTAVGVFL